MKWSALATIRRISSITQIMEDQFLYFGYGSNLLQERIRLMNPTAVFKTTAKLSDYKLNFNYASKRWMGAAATLEETPGDHVWGVVWQMHKDNLTSLDDQEGVHTGIYRPIEVEVETADGERLTCRSYQLLILNAKDPRPSPHYMDVIIRGAMQNNLPVEYVHKLRNIETNGYSGECKVYASLKLPDAL